MRWSKSLEKYIPVLGNQVVYILLRRSFVKIQTLPEVYSPSEPSKICSSLARGFIAPKPDSNRLDRSYSRLRRQCQWLPGTGIAVHAPIVSAKELIKVDAGCGYARSISVIRTYPIRLLR